MKKNECFFIFQTQNIICTIAMLKRLIHACKILLKHACKLVIALAAFKLEGGIALSRFFLVRLLIKLRKSTFYFCRVKYNGRLNSRGPVTFFD